MEQYQDLAAIESDHEVLIGEFVMSRDDGRPATYKFTYYGRQKHLVVLGMDEQTLKAHRATFLTEAHELWMFNRDELRAQN